MLTIDKWVEDLILALDIKMEKGDHWVTLSNGHRVMLDGEGVVKAGYNNFIGKPISEITSPETKEGQGKGEKAPKPIPIAHKNTPLHPKQKLPSSADFIEKNWQRIQNEKKGISEDKARREAAKEYFRTYLQNKFVETTIDGQPAQVHLTGKTWSEFFKDPHNFEAKAAVLQKVPELIRKGEKTAEYQLPKHDHKDFDGFYHIEQKILDPRDGTKKLLVILDVGKTAKSREDYNQYFFTAHTATDAKKSLASLLTTGKPSKGATVTFDSTKPEDIIPDIYEIVKLDVQEDSAPAADSASINAWLKRRQFF